MKKQFTQLSVISAFIILSWLAVVNAHAQPVPITSELKATDPNGVPLMTGSVVTVLGVVWSPTNLDPTSHQRYIQDTGTKLGVFIYGSGSYANAYCPAFSRGDLLYAVGTIGNYYGLLEVMLTATTENLGPSPIAPSIATVANILTLMSFDSTAQTGGEFYESQPIAIANVTVLQTINIGSTRDFNIPVGDASANTTGGYIRVDGSNFVWRIDKDTDVDDALHGRLLIRGQVIPVLVGVGCQFDTVSPYTTGYQLISMSASDFEVPEYGRVANQLNWMWATQTALMFYGMPTYKGVSIKTATGNFPYTSTAADAVRNFAYSPVYHHIYTVSVRAGTPNLQYIPVIYDATSGDTIGSLDTTGISGGTFLLCRLGADDYGAIYGCNLQSTTGIINIYRWADETSKPVNIFSYLSPARTGDGFHVQTMNDGSVKILPTGSNNSIIYIIDYNTTSGSASLFAIVTTNLLNTSPGVANLDPDTWDLWIKRYGMATYVVPSTVWMPDTIGGGKAIDVLNNPNVTVIGMDLIPAHAVTLNIVKRGGKKFLVTEDAQGRITGIGTNVASGHAIIFDITDGIPSPTGLTQAETKYYGCTDNTCICAQFHTAVDGSSCATIDKYGNVIHLVENIGIASWGPDVTSVSDWAEYNK